MAVLTVGLFSHNHATNKLGGAALGLVSVLVAALFLYNLRKSAQVSQGSGT